jgi:hypothetical protein
MTQSQWLTAKRGSASCDAERRYGPGLRPPWDLGSGHLIRLLTQDAGTRPVPWHMAQAAFGAQAFGTFGFWVHSNRPRPSQPGHGTVFSSDGFAFIPSSDAGSRRPG